MSDQTKYPSQLAERFQIRMPEGLRDRLREAADSNHRSMNAEIVARLESTFGARQMSKDQSEQPDEFQTVVDAIWDLGRYTDELRSLLAQAAEGKGPLVLAAQNMSATDRAAAHKQATDMVLRKGRYAGIPKPDQGSLPRALDLDREKDPE